MEKKIGMIANGVNIDHIPQGNALNILRYLRLERKYPVGIGLNLPSERMVIKDLVKIENYHLTDEQIKAISVLAPHATFSEIVNYEVVRKFQLTIPEIIEGLVICPNHRCVSHQYRSKFSFTDVSGKTIAHCCYCDHNYDLSEVREFNL
ncbi:MAG: aspartate carbamoyltransferase regulatory subunit [Neisseriaceae bacterium]|jgi:aspartate carbamoyltransferase regulatory subunit|nr:MAG: aspartate carbamoyltransferase regulatory subunit [Neisseriaceae bacterium]